MEKMWIIIPGAYLLYIIIEWLARTDVRVANDKTLANALMAVESWVLDEDRHLVKPQKKSGYNTYHGKYIKRTFMPSFYVYYIDNIGAIPRWSASHKLVRKIVRSQKDEKRRLRDRKVRKRYEEALLVKIGEN